MPAAAGKRRYAARAIWTKEEKEAIRYLSFDPEADHVHRERRRRFENNRTSIRFAPSPSRKCRWCCAAVEADIAELDDEERDGSLKHLEEPGLNRDPRRFMLR